MRFAIDVYGYSRLRKASIRRRSQGAVSFRSNSNDEAVGKQTIRSSIEGVGAMCESPIEVAMTLSLGIAARSQDYAVLFDFRGAQIFGDIESDTTVRIRPQVLFGEYRIDLLVSMQLIEGPENEIRVINKLVVVECDGFDFHRSKEQACRDRQRDRYLQSLGLPVLRFAGSEIWGDVFRCAGSVLSFLLAAVATEMRGPSLCRKPSASEKGKDQRAAGLTKH
jgi:hypothetical protein